MITLESKPADFSVETHIRYICPTCDKHHLTPAGAEMCVRKDIVREKKAIRKKNKYDYVSNTIRMSVSRVEDLPSAMMNFADQYQGVVLSFNRFDVSRLKEISITHNAPIGVQTCGWFNDCKYYKGYEITTEGVAVWKNKRSKLSGKNEPGLLQLLKRNWHDDTLPVYHMHGIHGGGSSGNCCTGWFCTQIVVFVDDFPLMPDTLLKDEFLSSL